ncbi:hypothetical protein CEP53_014752 [Fusarium sp. AF-6]|nr:hypothetical protein CEP53_014752 [Fusarium sp. AF-6]
MRGSAQTAKAWRSWHRSLHLRTRRSAQFQYLYLHQGDEGKKVPSAFGYLTILAKTAKTFRSLLPSCPDFCVNVKGAHPPPGTRYEGNFSSDHLSISPRSSARHILIASEKGDPFE